MLIQKLIAPFDRPAKGLLTQWRIPRAVLKKRQPLLEPQEQRLRRKHFDSGRRELDGERKSVEAAADGGHRLTLAVEAEARFDRTRASLEEPNG